MWNWADDYGIGTANGKQLIGFAFPNDDEITAKDFPTLRKEVADCFGVVYFDYEGRPYFTIPSWDKHQRTERKAKKNEQLIAAAERAVLAHDHAEVGTSDLSEGFSDATQGDSGPGTGEKEQGKGNRGTGEITPLTPQGELVTLPIPFEQVWDSWPKKTEKDRAEKEYRKHSRDVPDLADLIATFGDAYARTTEKQFIPSLAAWLHRKRWTDELPQPRGGGSRVQQGLSVAEELRRMEAGNAGE